MFRSITKYGVLMPMLLLVQPALAQPVVETLENGLRLVVEVDDSKPVASFRIYVGAGSIHEGEYLGGGISHFVEHVLSKGSQSRTHEEIDAAIDRLGNRYNAYTTSDHTCYYITVAGEDIGEAIEVLSDFVLHPVFPEEHVEIERGVIWREMAMGDDDPNRRSYHLMAETMFKVHPQRYRTIGYRSVFDQLTREDLVAYHRDMYVPDNMVVVAVGDFDGEAVLEQLQTIFRPVPRRPMPAIELAQEPDQIAPRRRAVADEAVGRAYLRIGWPTITLFHPDLYALDTLAYYLAGGDSAVLRRLLRDELGLVDAISAYSATPAYHGGHFAVTATLDPANLDRVEREVIAALARVIEQAPAEQELERVRRQVEAGEVFAQESAEGRASSLGRNLMITGDVNFTERYVEGIRAVTPEQVQDVARRYLRPERMNVAVLGPPVEETVARADDARAPGAHTSVRTLDNGMTVVVRTNRAVPAVSIATATLGGLRYETPETAGITALMAEMLVRGTENHSRESLAARVDGLGGSLSPYSGRNSFGIMAQFLADDLPEALELTVEALFRPTFPAEELERQRQLQLASIARREDNVVGVAFRELMDTLFVAHPYRFMPEGTADAVARITADDLREFHGAWAMPATTAIVIAGDVDPSEVFARIAALAAELEAAVADAPQPPHEPAIESPRERTLERNQQQAIVAYGFHGIVVDDPRRPALDLLDAIVSGASHPGGRLHESLRGQELVYFVHGMAIPGIETGAYVIYAGTAPEQVEAVRQEIEKILSDIAINGPSDEEIALARHMTVIDHQIGLQTNSSLAQSIALDIIYGLGAEHWETYPERINAVDAQQIRELAAELLNLERSVTVVTTPSNRE
jgi:zinc protease